MRMQVLLAYAFKVPDEDGRALIEFCRKHVLRFQPDPQVTGSLYMCVSVSVCVGESAKQRKRKA